MTPDEILKEFHKLPLPEQKQVIDALSSESNEEPEEELDDDQRLQRVLFAKGKISVIKPPYTKRIGDFPAVKLDGPPLSEMIIKERR